MKSHHGKKIKHDEQDLSKMAVMRLMVAIRDKENSINWNKEVRVALSPILMSVNKDKGRNKNK